MATYRARMMDADSGGEGIYDYEDDEDLLRQSPVRVIRNFMEHVGRDIIPENYEDYELNAAFKNDTAQVIAGLGSLILVNRPPLPFVIMISSKSAEQA